MKVNPKGDYFARFFLVAFWCAWQVLCLYSLLAWVHRETLFSDLFLLMALSVLGTAVIWWMLSAIPVVELAETGVSVRVFIKKRNYQWKSIRQVGVLWHIGRGMEYNSVVLLKQNGSCRVYQDKTFLLRNIGKTIQFRHSPEAIRLINKYYGALDFDLSDGRIEKIVPNCSEER